MNLHFSLKLVVFLVLLDESFIDWLRGFVATSQNEAFHTVITNGDKIVTDVFKWCFNLNIKKKIGF